MQEKQCLNFNVYLYILYLLKFSLQKIISYLSLNCTIELGMLFEAPFNEINDIVLKAVIDYLAAYKIISILEHINENVKLG